MDISTVMKITGILVAGSLGVLGIVTDTRDKKTDHLTRWGRWALWLTIAGALLALGAQIADSLSESKRDHAILLGLQDQTTKAAAILNQNSQILSGIRYESTTTNDIVRQNGAILTSTQEQSEIASKSLVSIQDLLSQVDEIHIDAEFELPQSDTRVKELAEEFHQLANLSTLPAGRCSGFELRSKSATIICQPFDPGEQPPYPGLPAAGTLNRLWQALPLMTGRVWFSKTMKTVAMLTGLDEAKTDLFMFNCNRDTKNVGAIIYYESVRKIYLRPTLFSSTSKISDCWFTKDTAIGIHSLADAQVTVEFNWRKLPNSSEVDPLLYNMRPDFIDLETGKSSLFLRKLATTIQKPQGAYAVNFVLSVFSQAQLPDALGIASRSLAVPPPRMR